MRPEIVRQISDSKKENYFGPEYEFDLIGGLDIGDPKYQFELRRLQKEAEKRGLKIWRKNSLPFREALELTKKFQPGDPKNPKKEFAREFRLAFAEKLGLQTDEELDRVEIYTCIRGPLDSLGYDGFLRYASLGGDKNEHLIFFDISKNPDKESATKADLLIGRIPDRSDADFDEKAFFEIVDSYAEEAAAVLHKKVQRGKEQEYYAA